jgi:hypothetical protein
MTRGIFQVAAVAGVPAPWLALRHVVALRPV